MRNEPKLIFVPLAGGAEPREAKLGALERRAARADHGKGPSSSIISNHHLNHHQSSSIITIIMIILTRWRTARTAPSWNSRGRSRRSRSFSQWWVAFVQTSKRKLGKVKVVDLTSKKFNGNSFPFVLSVSSKSACFVTLLLISMTMVMKMTTASFRGLTGDFAGGCFPKERWGGSVRPMRGCGYTYNIHLFTNT